MTHLTLEPHFIDGIYHYKLWLCVDGKHENKGIFKTKIEFNREAKKVAKELNLEKVSSNFYKSKEA